MRRLAPILPLFLLACHPTQASPTPSPVAVDASAAARPLDPADPASLSHVAEDSAQVDPALAVAADGTVAIAWTSVREHLPSVVRVRISRDDGATWEATQTFAAPDDRSASHPALATDGGGDVYLAWLGGRSADAGTPDMHVYVARADAKAASFGEPEELSKAMRHGAILREPRLAVTGAGSVLATWSYTHPDGDGVAVARTTDGHKWTPGVIIERIGLGARLHTLCSAPHGDRAWITYLDADAGVRLRGSDDGGTVWSPGRVATVSLFEDRPALAAINPLCAGDGETVTVAYGRGRASDAGATTASSIVVARSIDGGRTFDIRHTYESPVPILGARIAPEPDGAASVAFYTAGASADDFALRWFHIDERGSLAPPRTAREHMRLAAADALTGDAFGWSWHDGTLFAASADTTDGKSHVAFDRIPAAEARAASPAASRERPAAP